MKDYRIRLQALTAQARAALFGRDDIDLDRNPFRVGRESRERSRLVPRLVGPAVPEQSTGMRRTNELYLLEPGRVKFVSREHFQIEWDEAGRFRLSDRGSACGTMVNGLVVGGDRRPASVPLESDAVIVVGAPDSPYAFRFVVEAVSAQISDGAVPLLLPEKEPPAHGGGLHENPSQY